MAKKKEEVVVENIEVSETPSIALLEEAFGNGDLNVLKDKINEIIKSITR